MLAKLPTERLAYLEAADLIEEYGHCKGTREDAGRFCILGALSKAVTGNAWKIDSYHKPAKLLRDYLGTHPVEWNNAKERTKDEVVSALRSAALHGL